MSEPTWNLHDKFCPCVDGPCCPWMGPCECQCNCDFVVSVRADERQSALRDAVNAVTDSHLKTDDGRILRQGGDWENAIDRAIDAIEGLAGAR